MDILTTLKGLFQKQRKSEVVGGAVYSRIGESIDTRLTEAVDLFKEDPVIFGAIQQVANFISASGFEFYYTGRGKGESTLAYMNKWAAKKKLKSKIRNWAITHLIYDDVFIEVDRKGKDFYILDSETIEIKYDEHGKILAYIQRIDGNEITLPKDRIVHFKMNTAGSEIWGLSPLIPLYRVIKDKLVTEAYTEEFFRRHATPRLVYTFPANWNEDAKKAFIRLIKSIPMHGDIAIPEGVDVKVIGSVISDMQFRQWLEYLKEQITTATGLHPIILGVPEGSNRANSQVQMQAFKLRVKAVQNEIEDFFNTEILPRLFPDKKIMFRFKEIDLTERKDRAQLYYLASRGVSSLVRFGVLTPEEAKEHLRRLIGDEFD